MSQLIELNEADEELELSFSFDRALKDFVKSLPRARFDWTSKTWRFPVETAASIVPVLVARGFATSDKVKPLLGEEAGPPTTSVRQLNQAISKALNQGIPGPIWVAGELANWNRNAHRRHAYFELLDTNAIGRAEAMIGAVMFGSARERIEARAASSGIELADGLSVRLLVRVEMYEERGKIQVIVEDIDVAYSAGELALRKEEVLRALREKGVAERQLQREMPLLPRRIALLTSAQSDAYHDFVHTLERAPYGFEIVPFDVRVQGADLEETVTNALRAIEKSKDRFDLVVITRGGGSRTELASWDSLRVAYAVCASRTKVVVAIGHQQDRSVLDEVATSFKTPTEAAERIVERWAQAEACVDALSERLARQVGARVGLERERVENRVLRLSA
ncbi:MAG: exodeoxyribonuclease VII large subunit, partial [Bradymonadia bacterium]